MEEIKSTKPDSKRAKLISKHKTTNSSQSPTKPKTKPRFNIKLDKKIIYAICGVVAILSIALIAWSIISSMNKKVSEETTFATNDTQTTITIEPTDDSHSGISHTRTVYEYDGDNVVGMKTYFEYADNEAAKIAYEAIKDQPEFKGAEVIDKYIVVTADPSQFKGLTAEDIRQQSENLKQYYQSHKSSEPADQPESQPEDQPEGHPEGQPDEQPEQESESPNPDEG